MDIRTFSVEIAGQQVLLHNGQLSDPLNPHAKALKAVTSKKNKSDDDHIKVGELEFQGSLYIDPEMGPYIPGDMLDAAIKEGARKKRLGKIFESCVTTVGSAYALQYDGPRTREGLWADPRFRDHRGVKLNKVRITRTRPKFTNWSVKFELQLFPCEINVENVKSALVDAGTYIGIGDFRPRFGLFTVKSFQEVTTKPA